jgi:hypothetical protein
MVNSYSIIKRTSKYTKKNYSFTFWTLTVLNSFIFITSCGAKLTHRDFRLALVKDLIQEGIRVPQTALRGRPTPLTKNLTRLDFWQSPHWPQEANRIRCRMCSAANKQTLRKVKCEICNVGLCLEPCFKIYHTKLNF